MTEIPAAPEVARRLADALEGARIPYAIGDAIAYGPHALPRATNDVDLNVFAPLDELDRVFNAFEAGGAVIYRAPARRSASERGDFVARVRKCNEHRRQKIRIGSRDLRIEGWLAR